MKRNKKYITRIIQISKLKRISKGEEVSRSDKAYRWDLLFTLDLVIIIVILNSIYTYINILGSKWIWAYIWQFAVITYNYNI